MTRPVKQIPNEMFVINPGGKPNLQDGKCLIYENLILLSYTELMVLVGEMPDTLNGKLID